MKRLIAWLLLGCTLLMCSCGAAEEISSQVSGESSAESKPDEESSVTEEPFDPRFTVVSVGKPYTVSVAASDAYADFYGQQLTDGQKAYDIGVHYTDPRMVGYTDDISVIIDLGEDGKRLSGAAVRGLDMNKDGVKIPLAVRVYGSNDAKQWSSLGKSNFTQTGDMTVSTAKVSFKELADYRYVRVRVTRTGGFIFIDEVEVYADVDPKEQSTGNAEQLYANEDLNRGAWSALSTGITAKPTYSENLALYKKYTFENCTFDPRAPQNATYLTDDARTGRLFEQSVWVGLQGTGSVTVDLGKTEKNVYAVKAYALGKGYEVTLPDAVDFYGSYDGKNYYLLGRAYRPAEGDHHVFTLLLPEYIKARYIKMEIPSGQGNYWFEEIQVMGGLSESPETELYPPLDLPYVPEDEYWDSSEPDYKKEQNLLLGLTQQVASSGYEPSDALYSGSQKRTEADSPILTDGLLADSNYMNCYNGEWFFMQGGNAYDFFYDLGKVCTLNSFEISLLEQTDWGISRPKAMSIFLSVDGETWYEVYEYMRDENGKKNASATRLNFECELKSSLAARFVRFRLEGGVMFVDEFRAFGTKRVKDSVKRLADSGISPVIYYTNPSRKQYANSENTGVKAEDIILTFGNVDYGEDLKAYVAYVDEEGKAVDFLFDGFVYFHHNSTGTGNDQLHLYNTKADWEVLFDSVFNGVGGLDLLEQTVGQVKEELNKPDHVVYVYINMWCICEKVTDFGDVDGDGQSENLSKASDRKKVVDWFTSKCIETFAERGYEHLVLDGFYWNGESINWDNPATEVNEDNSHIITEVSEYIHATGTNFLWIPYYTANRYYQGYELGFDMVCMQPNYMFDLTQPLYRFDVTASRTKWMKMCVEIEHSYQALSDPLFARNYMLYLYYGAITGYMNEATHIYYADVDNYSQLAYSNSPISRMQYDATYQFIKGTLEPNPEKLDTLQATGNKDTMLEGTLNASGDPLALFTLNTSASHGYVTVSSDGSFRYFPDKGFTGTDSFTYTYNNYMGESVPCTVEITVK